MAPRPAVSTVVAALLVVVVIVVVVVACQLPCANGGGVTVQAFDGTTAAQGQCVAEEQELVRKPTAKYISYAALRADQIPCNKPRNSYYTNCGAMQQANPYTRCARNMN